MIKVVIIGSGNVAQHLILAFLKADNVELVQAFARNKTQLAHLLDANKITSDYNQLKEADLYIISVSDDVIIWIPEANIKFQANIKNRELICLFWKQLQFETNLHLNCLFRNENRYPAVKW